MTWSLLVGLVMALGLAFGLTASRRKELRRQAAGVAERARAVDRGSAKAQLQYPHVDLTRCIGCGLCVTACPEEGVLDILHGQAVVVHGARCVGHGRCAEACPTNALAVTLGQLDQRRDIPALSPELEVVGRPGVFLAGEVTGYALIRTAIRHGTAVAAEVARRVAAAGPSSNGTLDLAIVGAGPAGIASALEARRHGLRFVVLDQEGLGGTVARYPRRKLVMTQPVDLPLYGRLERQSYEKEELVELWERVVREYELPVKTGQTFTGLEPRPDGSYAVHSGAEPWLARHVCLALGRRGSPRKLGVPGEDLPKVTYALQDAQGYRERRVLVVGGGDSAIEAALGLAEQPGNEVTLSYRRPAFFRIKARNEQRFEEAVAAGELTVLFESQVVNITRDRVELVVGCEREPVDLPNDDVFVLAGGVPPFEVLERCGVSFDPAHRTDPAAPTEQGSGLVLALGAAGALATAALLWALAFASYYGAPLAARVDHPWHAFLRPSRGLGLALGLLATLLLGANLAYLARRSPRFPLRLGSLQRWMTAHVATGVGCLLCALLHSAMAPRDTVGGHALWGLAVLVGTGAVGRYLYAFIPRAANGRELALEEVRAQLTDLTDAWEGMHRGLAEVARAEIQALVDAGRWSGGFLARLGSLVAGQRGLRRALDRIEGAARHAELPEDRLDPILQLARRAYRSALAAAHYEELRGLLAGWRYLHRWVAFAMVLLVTAHVVTAVRFASLWGSTS